MKIPRYWHLAFLLPVSVLIAAGCSKNQSGQTPTSADAPSGDISAEKLVGSVPFGAAEIFIEYNSSANDAGIQVFLDAEDWKRVDILDGQGKNILDIQAGGSMKELGLTELRFEGAEPGPTEVFDVFAAGEYTFRGVTIDREQLVGSATLSHDLPPAPVFSPSNGEVVDPDNVVVTWAAIAGVESYQVIVESDANSLVLEISLAPGATSMHVPPTFLVPNTLYKTEVLAIAPNGNRTLTEGTFVTGP
jgi:hypothetical protein